MANRGLRVRLESLTHSVGLERGTHDVGLESLTYV
jgi:hypothetical protein